MTVQESYQKLVDRVGKNPKFDEGVLGIPLKIQMIPINLLRIDETYQRFLSLRVIENARQFNYLYFRPLSTFLRPNGEHYVNDGQHELIMAFLSKGIKTIPCTVIEHPKHYSVEECRKDEAEHFEKLNMSRKNISRIDAFRAGISYKDDESLFFEAKLKLFEVQVEELGDPNGYEVKSWAKLEWCWKRKNKSGRIYPDAVIRKAIDLLKDVDRRVWNKGHLNGAICLGVTMIFDLLDQMGDGLKYQGLKHFMENNFEKFPYAYWTKGFQGSLGHYDLVRTIIDRSNDSVRLNNSGAIIGDDLMQNYGLISPSKK